MNRDLYLSIVVPFFNEEDNAAILVKKIDQELAQLSHKFEIICVDDGSTDNTINVLLELADEF